jgi:hypothetical protein
MNTRPHPIFLVVWAFWWLGCPIYTYGLATGQEWATPVGGFTWLAMFGWFEAFPLILGQYRWTLSGVIGWLIALLTGGDKDRSWHWLADALALPIAVLIVVTFAALFGGWVGWTLGLGWGGLTLVLLRRHWRFMAGAR